jgi:hypothetical protein
MQRALEPASAQSASELQEPVKSLCWMVQLPGGAGSEHGPSTGR